jgi:hypothetical protein
MTTHGHTELTDRVLSVIREIEECDMEELVLACGRGFSSNQVFCEVDRLSRIGELSLLYRKDIQPPLISAFGLSTSFRRFLRRRFLNV